MNMAQPNVVREPSMEEILASIRRIIESNEPGGAKPISSTNFTNSGARDDDIRLTVDEEFAAADRALAAEAEPRFVAANSQMPVAEPQSADRGLSLADVAARVRAASERNAALLSAGRAGPERAQTRQNQSEGGEGRRFHSQILLRGGLRRTLAICASP